MDNRPKSSSKILNILLYILIDIVLLGFSVFSFFIFKEKLIIIPFLLVLVVIYLVIFFLFVLVINPYKDSIIDIKINENSLTVIRKDKEVVYKYKTLLSYKTRISRKDEIKRIILHFDTNEIIVIKGLSIDSFNKLISYIEGEKHED